MLASAIELIEEVERDAEVGPNVLVKKREAIALEQIVVD